MGVVGLRQAVGRAARGNYCCRRPPAESRRRWAGLCWIGFGPRSGLQILLLSLATKDGGSGGGQTITVLRHGTNECALGCRFLSAVSASGLRAR